jgi:CubicO group peptidase (beta-lactamase class C family)
MKRTVIAILFSITLMPFAFGQASAPELQLNKPVERELKAGEAHSYRVSLKAGQLLRAVADQRGIDILVRVFGPDGKQMAEIDSPNGNQGPEHITINAEASGSYRIDVLPFEEKSNAGRYEIRIDQIRAAATTPTGKVDELFAQWDKPDSPGASVIVVKDGQVVYKRGYGIANLEYDVAITPSTVFHVASVSKQFTAFAIAMLAGQGKLSLDDDIRKHLPELADFGKTITIRHLIHHTSGLRDQWELLAIGGWRLDDVITRDHIMKMVRHQKELNFEPGQEFLYSNTGYTLMAEIVERVTGESFREFTDKAIFKPLGMTSTHFHDDHQRVVKNRAYSYSPIRGGYRLSALNYANVGATSLFTTVEDLAKWALNFEDGRVGGKSVVEQMYQQGVLNDGEKIGYAFGLGIGEYRGLKRISHSGGDAGYRSYIVRFPDQRFIVAVLSNLATFNPGRLAEQAADIYLGKEFKPDARKPEAEKRSEVSVSAEALKDYAGMYQFRPGWVVTVSIEESRLMVRATGEPKFSTQAESETKFFVPAYGAPVVFQRDESGKVNQLQYRGMRAQRVFAFKPTAEELKEFTGDYYSDELGTSYKISLKDGQLVVQHRRNDDVKLTPSVTDQFSGSAWWFREIQFTRDGQKRVIGFRLTGGRVRSLRFDKQSP